MNQLCDDCPFAESGAGLHLRQSLRKGRWRGILMSVRLGQPFYCHKTTNPEGDNDDDTYTANGKEQLCAGSITYLRTVLQRLPKRKESA